MPSSPHASPKRIYHEEKDLTSKKEKEEMAKKLMEQHDVVKQVHHIKKSTIESDRLGKNLHMA